MARRRPDTQRALDPWLDRVHLGDCVEQLAALPERSVDVVFADPPYASDTAHRLVEQWLAVPFATVFAVEHSAAVALPAIGETRRYGTTALTFFRTVP